MKKAKRLVIVMAVLVMALTTALTVQAAGTVSVLTKVVRSNGSSDEYTYNKKGLLVKAVYKVDKYVDTYTYTYDKSNRLKTARKDWIVDTSSGETFPMSETYSISYDKKGRVQKITEKADTENSVTTYKYKGASTVPCKEIKSFPLAQTKTITRSGKTVKVKQVLTGMSMTCNYTYKFKANGLLTSYTMVSKGQGASTNKRTISYKKTGTGYKATYKETSTVGPSNTYTFTMTCKKISTSETKRVKAQQKIINFYAYFQPVLQELAFAM